MKISTIIGIIIVAIVVILVLWWMFSTGNRKAVQNKKLSGTSLLGTIVVKSTTDASIIPADVLKVGKTLGAVYVHRNGDTYKFGDDKCEIIDGDATDYALKI